jgi:hypothetical protein
MTAMSSHERERELDVLRISRLEFCCLNNVVCVVKLAHEIIFNVSFKTSLESHTIRRIFIVHYIFSLKAQIDRKRENGKVL